MEPGDNVGWVECFTRPNNHEWGSKALGLVGWVEYFTNNSHRHVEDVGSREDARPSLRKFRHRPVLASEWTQPTMRDCAFSRSFFVKKSSGLTRSTG
jgi:hypothetical protein